MGAISVADDGQAVVSETMRKRAEWMVLGLMVSIGLVLGLSGHWHGAVLMWVLSAVLEIGVWIDRRRGAGHHGERSERVESEAADGDQPETGSGE